MLMNRLNDFIFSTDPDSIDHMIARYMKDHIESIHQMTIEEIANGCFVSKAKISGFCKKLGYDNYIAFKDECSRYVLEKDIVISYLEENDEIDFKEHVQLSFQRIRDGLLQVNQKMIDTLVQEIYQAEYIYAYGVGYSNLLCRYFQYDMDFFEKKVIVLDEKLHKEVPIKEGSILIVFSIEGFCFQFDTRLIRKLNKYPFRKWIITTDCIHDDILSLFQNSLVIPTSGADMKDRRILLRYFMDVLIGRYHYRYADKAV